MTIPMMPGWWDQSGESVQNLLTTLTRAANPNFDNQLALAQFMRQNPANAQAVVDFAAMNPDAVARQYGQTTLGALSNMGRPSVGAQIEMEAQRQLGGETVEGGTPTVLGEAARRRLEVPTVTERRREALTLTGLQQDIDVGAYNFDQKRFEDSLKNPELRRQYETTAAALQAFPESALLNPISLAERQVKGEFANDARFGQQLAAFAAANPEAFEVYKQHVQNLNAMARDNEVDRRLTIRLNNEAQRAERSELSRARQWAAQQSAKTSLNVPDLIKWYMGESVPLVDAWYARDEAAQQARATAAALGKINDDLVNAAKMKNTNERALALRGVGAALSTLVGEPVDIKKVSQNVFSSANQFVLSDGTVLTGDDLYRMIDNPEGFRADRERKATIEAMTLPQVDAAMEALRNARQTPYYQQNPQEFTNYMSALDAKKKKLERAARGAAR